MPVLFDVETIRRLRAEAPRLPDDASVVQRTRPSSCSLLAWDCVSAKVARLQCGDVYLEREVASAKRHQGRGQEPL